MEKRTLGRAGFDVTALGYGAMELRRSEVYEHAETLLNTALDAGIRFIDTSQDYRESEALIGRYLSHRRDEFRLATKCGCNLSGTGPAHIFTRAQFLHNLEDSLRKLRTDHLDLWQIHCVTPPDLPGGAQDDAIGFMLDAKAQGKVAAIGLSFQNGSLGHPFYPTGYQEQYAVEMAQWGVFDAIQIVYGALTPVSGETIDALNALGVGVIVRGALKRYFPEQDGARLDRAGLQALCEPGETVDGLLLRYALSKRDVSTVIVGSGNPAHILQNARAAARGPLSPQVCAELARRLG